MFNTVVNDWGETTYLPTTAGKLVLLLILAALLAGAVLFARKYAAGQEHASSGGKLTVKQLVFCAMAIALGTVLSNIKLFHFPTGGSITLLSMLIICLPGYFFGLGAGLLTGVAYGILQLLIDPYVLFPMQLVVDYLLAFGALGLSGLFCNARHGLLKGYLAAVLGRYVFAVISGWIFFGSYAWEGWGALPYSLVYNAIYIFAEAIVTVIILMIPAVSKGLARVKGMAVS
ncbi:MAG: energy-coupled thiamine transporter ThiT [Clostridiales bacterium]|nr:energy-coupled thiamine transporter ThiT [Clostridiales bacterium]